MQKKEAKRLLRNLDMSEELVSLLDSEHSAAICGRLEVAVLHCLDELLPDGYEGTRTFAVLTTFNHGARFSDPYFGRAGSMRQVKTGYKSVNINNANIAYFVNNYGIGTTLLSAGAIQAEQGVSADTIRKEVSSVALALKDRYRQCIWRRTFFGAEFRSKIKYSPSGYVEEYQRIARPQIMK